jgi:hypothetical protein
MKVPYIHTNSGISVVLGGRPFHAAVDDKYYDEVVRLVESGASSGELIEVFERAAKRLKEATGLTPDMVYSGGVIKFRGEVLHNYAADRLISMIEAGRDHAPLARFLEKLQANPSKRVVDNLYEFLERGNIPLTEDGDFLAYKAVRADFRDIHSGTFDNSLGEICRMARNRVDEDPNRTCSAGLHVCSFDYLPHFSHANGHVVIVKVSPADVVAIPADYNATKMRVSEYRVIGEVEGYYSKREDVLGGIGRDDGIAPMFTLRDVENNFLGEFFTLAEAKLQARDYATTDGELVTVTDSEDMVLWTVDATDLDDVIEY